MRADSSRQTWSRRHKLSIVAAAIVTGLLIIYFMTTSSMSDSSTSVAVPTAKSDPVLKRVRRPIDPDADACAKVVCQLPKHCAPHQYPFTVSKTEDGCCAAVSECRPVPQAPETFVVRLHTTKVGLKKIYNRAFLCGRYRRGATAHSTAT